MTTPTTMELDGYTAVLQYDPESARFRGEIQGLNGGADFYGSTVDGLRREFRASLDCFQQVCARHGVQPGLGSSNRSTSGACP
ncbi:type II toxin-antitoxin system HicB family antitoxin [Melaminivora jejuensis]|uniref:type II toxin-antitoxin system HicB family antitoxin n=1 Tax=Melaminivora jejuensis TaxID=1267217 RepID=UPI001ADFDF57|nr:type II toxin-antitoxin system HicB family antitoxin [Melaminivora jejuensis]UHJ64022.1 type II toxin-antitoxin system HicB family antitoxin [Melaminivora jejuensis]